MSSRQVRVQRLPSLQSYMQESLPCFGGVAEHSPTSSLGARRDTQDSKIKQDVPAEYRHYALDNVGKEYWRNIPHVE